PRRPAVAPTHPGEGEGDADEDRRDNAALEQEGHCSRDPQMHATQRTEWTACLVASAGTSPARRPRGRAERALASSVVARGQTALAGGAVEEGAALRGVTDHAHADRVAAAPAGPAGTAVDVGRLAASLHPGRALAQVVPVGVE